MKKKLWTWAAAVLMLPLAVSGSANHSGEANMVGNTAGKRTAAAGLTPAQPDYLEICRGIVQK